MKLPSGLGRLPLGESPERWRVTRNNHLVSAYIGFSPDSHPSESTTYIGSHLDGYPSGSPLKDGDSPTMTARCQPISGLHLDGHLSESTAYIGSYPDGYPSGSPLKDESSPIMTARSLPIRVFTLTGTRVTAYTDPTLTATRKNNPCDSPSGSR